MIEENSYMVADVLHLPVAVVGSSTVDSETILDRRTVDRRHVFVYKIKLRTVLSTNVGNVQRRAFLILILRVASTSPF